MCYGVLEVSTRGACCLAPSLPQDGNHTTVMNQSAPSVKEHWAFLSQMQRGFPTASGEEGALSVPLNLHPFLIQSLGSCTMIFQLLHLDDFCSLSSRATLSIFLSEGRCRDKMMRKFLSNEWVPDTWDMGHLWSLKLFIRDLCQFVLLHGKKNIVSAFQEQRL